MCATRLAATRFSSRLSGLSNSRRWHFERYSTHTPAHTRRANLSQCGQLLRLIHTMCIETHESWLEDKRYSTWTC